MDKVLVVTKIFRKDDLVDRAIKSILNQTHQNLCFCIYYGNETEDIIKIWEKKDSRINGYPIQNNCNIVELLPELLELVQATWYMWLDADDWYDDNFLERMIELSKNMRVDILACGYRSINQKGEIQGIIKPKESIFCDSTETEKWFCDGWPFFSSTWGILYKTDILKKVDFSVRPDPQSMGYRGSDTVFNYMVLPHCKRIGIIDECFYNYQLTEQSQTVKYHKNRKYYSKIMFDFVMNALTQMGNKDIMNIYLLLIMFAESVYENALLVMSTYFSATEKYNELMYLFSQEQLKNVYEWTLKSRRDYFQNKFLNLVFQYADIFSQEEFENLVNQLYSNIFQYISKNDLVNKNISAIFSAKEKLVEDEIKNRL